MKFRTLWLPACALGCALSVFALQNALAPTGWGAAEVNQIAQSFFTNASADVTSFNGWLSKPVRDALRARPAASRAQVARDVALAAKRFVQAPGFEKTHTAWIRESLDAVDHGLKVDPNAPRPEPNEKSEQGKMAATLAEGLKTVPPEGLKMLLDSDVQSLSKSQNPADKERLDKVRQILALIPGRYPEAKKLYVIYLMAKMGGPSDEASIQAAIQDSAKADAEQKRREQQINYDKYNLKAQLRQRLGAFITEAKSVDFTAQTRARAGRLMFVNPEFEAKSGSWKLLFRMGREPVMAALAVAEQWLREL